MNRRGFLTGLAGILAASAAPGIVQAGSIMRIKPIVLPGDPEFVGLGVRHLIVSGVNEWGDYVTDLVPLGTLFEQIPLVSVLSIRPSTDRAVLTGRFPDR